VLIPKQRYRHTLLSFLHRLPHNEPFKVWENTVMELMIKLMKSENEENALVCIKIMIDGFRAHKVSCRILALKRWKLTNIGTG
jgi:transformation/transcription domain-associated protein